MKNINYQPPSFNGKSSSQAQVNNRRLISDESITEVSQTKFAQPFQTQSVAHNNFIDASNFTSTGHLLAGSILDQRANSVQSVPLNTLNGVAYNSGSLPHGIP